MTSTITGEMCVLDRTGDTRLTWDANNTDEVASVRRTFDELKGKGYLAYTVKPGDGAKGEVITAFDPNAQKVILAPPMRGG